MFVYVLPNKMLKLLIILFEITIAWFLIAPLAKLLLIGLSKLIYKPMPAIINLEYSYSYAAIITVHESTKLLEDIVESFNKQTYKNFTAYFVLDNCGYINVSHLESENIKFLFPEKPLHSKTRSIEFALNAFDQEYDAISLFEDGNLLHPDYFLEINKQFCKGYKAVQGAIKAKNFNTITANLDAANEAFYSFHDKESRNQLGLSASIWSLGFCIDSIIFKKIVSKSFKHHLIGCDKKIQAKLLLYTKHVAYAGNAIVFDEKTSSSKNMIKQKAVWFLDYYKNIFEALPILFKGIQTLSFDRINYALNIMRPPLTLVLSMACLLSVFNWFVLHQYYWLMPIAIASIAVAFISILFIKKVDRRVWNAMYQFPRLLLIQFLALFISNKSSESFYFTRHVVSRKVDDVLFLYK